MNLYTHLNLTSFSGLNNNNNISKSSSNTSLSTSKEYLKLIPPLSEVEFDSLKRSIKEEGLHIPVIVNKQGIVLDGHHRFRACKELRIPLQFHIKEFKDSGAATTGIAALRLKRRFIGIEKEQETFILAKGRIDLELSFIGSN
ncbi:MAG: DNA modification methylase [Thermoproteota archaeon]|nr:DNA modification methylase [Thermoproteota archaeon]